MKEILPGFLKENISFSCSGELLGRPNTPYGKAASFGGCRVKRVDGQALA